MARFPGWTTAIADQAIVAITNLLVTTLVARSAGLHGVGILALVSTTMLIALGITRMLVLEPFLAAPAARGGIGAMPMLIVGGAFLSGMLTGAVTVSLDVANIWLVTALIAALWTVQDAGRFLAFKADRQVAALASDSIVLASVAGSLALWPWLDQSDDLVATLLFWLAGQLIAVAVSRPFVGGMLAIRGTLRWWREHCKPLAKPLAVDGVAYMIGANASLYLLVALSSTTVAGEVRAATALFSPVLLALTGVSMWLTPGLAGKPWPELSGSLKRSGRAMALLGTPAVVLIILVGSSLSSHLFGADSRVSLGALVAAGLATLVTSISSVWVVGAKVLADYGGIARARLAFALATLGLLALVNDLRTPAGYLYLIGAQNVAVAIAAFWVSRRAARSFTNTCTAPKGKPE